MSQLPDTSILRALRREGLTLQQIADRFECSPGRVWAALTDHPSGPTVPPFSVENN